MNQNSPCTAHSGHQSAPEAPNVAAHNTAPQRPPEARTGDPLAILRERLVAQHAAALEAARATTGDLSAVHDGSRMGLDVALAELDALAHQLTTSEPPLRERLVEEQDMARKAANASRIPEGRVHSEGIASGLAIAIGLLDHAR